MANQGQQPFSEFQLRAIIAFQEKLAKTTKRNISLAEAIINWIALGYAEEYRSGYLAHDIHSH
jgi:hypothetical protein